APSWASRRAAAAPMPLLAPVTSTAVSASGGSTGVLSFLQVYDSGVVVGEVAGQVAVGAGLGQEGLCFLLDGGDRVGAGREPQWRLVLARELDQRVGEPGGVASLSAVHAVPSGDGLPGAL